MATRDPFVEVVVDAAADEFAELTRRPASAAPPPVAALPGAATARLHGFDLDDQPLLVGVPGLPGEKAAARTTVALHQAQIGSTVVVLFEQGDVRRPIVIGVLDDRASAMPLSEPLPPVSVQADGERMVIRAEREIVLRCGEASITLTRAGKVVIKGTYVLSRSSGVNRIKGAAVDIN
jgi:hypothetical protein